MSWTENFKIKYLHKDSLRERVQKFYDKTPFPDYEINRFNSKEDLKVKAYPFAKTLDRNIPADASIIDVGTGTGQLSAFLSLRRKCVWGIDFSDNSLKKAKSLKNKLKLDSLQLKRLDIMDQKEINNIGIKFDYVLCFGVLHHTANPYLGFQNIISLLKPNGHIAVGLYNKFARVPLKIRRFVLRNLHKQFKKNEKLEDKFIKIQIENLDDRKRARSWTSDQYFHPHESVYTIGEVLRWFGHNNIEFLQTVPSTNNTSNKVSLDISGLFRRELEPTLAKRFLTQFSWILNDDPNGGYWITFGRLKIKS